MTELEIMLHAKEYIDKMANGIDPLTGECVPDGDLINNVRISRCLFYVSGVLEKVIANGGQVQAKKVKKEPFAIKSEMRESIPVSDIPLTVTEIARCVDGFAMNENMKTFASRAISTFLTETGFLEVITIPGTGRTKRVPTQQGLDLGIYTEARNGMNGPYTAVLYSAAAQKFILDNLEAIIEINNTSKKSHKTGEVSE